MLDFQITQPFSVILNGERSRGAVLVVSANRKDELPNASVCVFLELLACVVAL